MLTELKAQAPCLETTLRLAFAYPCRGRECSGSLSLHYLNKHAGFALMVCDSCGGQEPVSTRTGEVLDPVQVFGTFNVLGFHCADCRERARRS